MKKLSVILFLSLLAGFSLNAQDSEDKEVKTLFSSSDISFSGFGGPIVQFGTAEDGMGVFPGGGGALLINQKFFIGGYGMGLANSALHRNVEVEGVKYDRLRTSFGHGGFWLGYIHNSQELLHLGFSSKFGWGELALYDDRFDFDHYDYLANDIVFVVTPQVEVEMNITHWFKLNVGAGYQFVSGVGNQTWSDNGEKIFEQKDFSTPQLTVGFLFGGFGS